MAKKIIDKVQSINIRLHGIELISSSFIQNPESSLARAINFNFNINVENRIDAVRKLIVSFVKVEIREVGKDLILASFSVAVGVEVVEFEKMLVMPDNTFFIPPQLDSIVKTISISTTRGIIYSELRGTYLHLAHLPIVFNPMPIVNK